MSQHHGESTGPATDRLNDPVIDPTKNVLDLVRAETKRQDDMRELEGRWRDRLDALRAEHAKEIRAAESGRIDAIRAVDVATSQQQTKDAEIRATALAGQVAAAADAVRVALAAETDPIKKDIGELRQAQYQTQGEKAQVVESRASWTFGQSIVAIVLAAVIGLSGLYLATRKTNTAPVQFVPVTVTQTVP